MLGFVLALQFLTQLPINTTARPGPRDVTQSYYFYPIVGLLIGLAAILLRRLLVMVFPLPFVITLVLAFLIWISGGLHEDGLADVADGMGGGWTREDRLRIMKDSRIGAFGASMLAIVLLAKYAALTSMTPARVDAAITAGQVLGRWAFLPMGYFNRYAREGLGSAFMKHLTAGAVVVGTVLAAGAVILFSGIQGTLAFTIAIVVVGLGSLYFRSRLGGITGDCLGATFQFVEIATYAAFLT